MSDGNVIQEVSNILLNLKSERPWMTATGLARRLAQESEHHLAPEEIETTLRQHTQKRGRRIRYSYYPSRRTLDILWGHVDKVEELMYLPPLERLDEPIEHKASPVDEHAPWFFISHNHLDLDRVFELREALIAKGYGVWIFETEIPRDSQIHASVLEAIQRCQYFISYVSARSIGSLWVQKEVEVALYASDNKPFIFLDGEDVKLLELFGNWGNTWPLDPKVIEEFCLISAKSIGKGNNSSWLYRCAAFIETLHEYLGSTQRVIAFPIPKNQDLWKSQALKLENLQEFLERIRK